MGTIIGDYIGTTIGSIHPFPTKNQGEGVGCAHGHRFLAFGPYKASPPSAVTLK